LILAGFGVGLYFLLRPEPTEEEGEEEGGEEEDDGSTPPGLCSLSTPPDTLDNFTTTCRTVTVLGTEVVTYDFVNEYVGIHTYDNPTDKWFLTYRYDGFYTYFALEAVSVGYDPTAWSIENNKFTAIRQDRNNIMVVGFEPGHTGGEAIEIGQTFWFPFGTHNQINYDSELENVIWQCVFDGWNFFFYNNENVFLLRAGRNNPNQYIWFDWETCPVSWIGNPDRVAEERQGGGRVPEDGKYFYLTEK
jgi:hypothetical protein